MRKQLTDTLERQAGWVVCGETRNGLKAVLLAHELKPDLVILDLVMPMLDGLTASAEIAKILPDTPTVIYSVEIPPELELEAKKFGVWAMVPKSAGEGLLIETIKRLLISSPSRLLPGSNDALAEVAPESAKPETTRNEAQADAESECSVEPN